MPFRTSARSLCSLGLSVTLLGSMSCRDAAAAPIHALSAEAFVDSVGVNTHLGYTDTAYGQHDALVAALKELGVKHLRDSGDRAVADRAYWDRLIALGDAGFRFDLIFAGSGSASIEDQLANPKFRELLRADAVRYVEGWNEPGNGASDPTQQVKDAAAYQQRIYAAVKADADARGVSVLGPSFHKAELAAAAGDLSDHLDHPVMHNYFGDRHPETQGWGGSHTIDGVTSKYGSTDYNLAAARQVTTGDKDRVPVVSTETGYSTFTTDDPVRSGITDATRAAYLPRLLLQQFADPDIAATYLYELADGRNDPNDREANFGLMHYNESTGQFQLNASGKAVQGLLARLQHTDNGSDSASDSGSTARPGGETLDLAITGGGDALRTVLLQRADGTFVLALWLAEAMQDPDGETLYELTPESVTLTFGEDEVTGAAISTFDATGAWSTQAGTLTDDRLTVLVDGRVTLVELAPGVEVPEPGSMLLLVMGGPLLWWRRR